MAFIDIDRSEDQGSGDEHERQLSVRDVIAVLFVHKWTIVVSFILILSAIYWGLSLRQTFFVGEVKYFVDRHAAQDMGITWVPGLDWEEEINSIAELGRSQGVLMATAKEYETLKGNPDISKDDLKLVAGVLGEYMDVNPVPETDIISVTVRDFDADTSLILADIYGRNFAAEYTKIRRREFSREFIRNNIEDLEAKIEEASRTRAEIQKEAGIYDWRAVETRLAENRAFIQRELVDLRGQMEGIGSQLRVDEEAFRDWGGEFLPSEALRTDPQIMQFQRRVVELEMALSSLRARYRDEHPLVAAKVDEIEKVKGKIREYFALNIEQRRQQLENMKAMGDLYLEELAAIEREFSEVPHNTAEIKYYEDYLEVQWDLYSKLVTRFNEKLVDEEFTIAGNQLVRLGEATIVDMTGLTPSIVNILVAPLFSLILAISVAFMVEATSQSFQKPEDLERFTGLPVFTTFRKI